MALIDLLPAQPAPAPIGLLHLVGLLEWQPPMRDEESMVTVRPGRWVATETGRSLLDRRQG